MGQYTKIKEINGIIHKKCPSCKEYKILEKFNYNADRPFNKSSWCKQCKSENSKTHGPTRHYKKYGISNEIYKELYKQQEGKCLICSEFSKTLDADHCHNTNRFRGLLCRKCNQGLGLFKDNMLLLMKATDYLQKAFYLELEEILEELKKKRNL